MCSINRAIKMFSKFWDVKNSKFVDVKEYDEATWYNKIKKGEKYCIAKKSGDKYVAVLNSQIKL